MKNWIGSIGIVIVAITIYMWENIELHYSGDANSSRGTSKWTLLLIGIIMISSFFFKEKPRDNT